MPILKKLEQHKILLDTHVWLWVVTGNSSLKPAFRSIFKHSIVQPILISPISIWEIGMLVEKKRIQLDRDVEDWIEASLNFPMVQLAAISPRIAIQSTRLPGLIHADPADRLLIATAHEENAVLVTCDEKLLKYGQEKFVTVYNPV